MDTRIHILGASGSGTTTLGAAIADRLGVEHLDSDDYYWKATPVRFSEKRQVKERLRMIETDIANVGSWVLSGSLCSWGDSLVDRFTHVIFLQTPWKIRESRLLIREEQRYKGIDSEHRADQEKNGKAFLEWAERYDIAGLEQRSLITHEHWLKALPDPKIVTRLQGELPTDSLVDAVIKSLD